MKGYGVLLCGEVTNGDSQVRTKLAFFVDQIELCKMAAHTYDLSKLKYCSVRDMKNDLYAARKFFNFVNGTIGSLSQTMEFGQ